MYDDDDEIRDVLRALAERERFQPIESDPVIRRGRCGVRRRRLAATSVAAAMVAAVAVTATALPDVGASGQTGPAAQTLTDDPALRLIDGNEAARRCRLQWSALAGHDVGPVRMKGRYFVHELYRRPLMLTDAERAVLETKRRQHDQRAPAKRSAGGPTVTAKPVPGPGSAMIGTPLEWFGFWPGSVEPVLDRNGKKFMCVIPAGWVPSAADLAADAQDGPLPTDDAGLLRRCSTIFWHDFSKWRVLARQVEQGVVASVAAMSPSGRLVVHCVVAGRSLRDDLYNAPSRLPGITGVQQPPAGVEYYKPSTESYVPEPFDGLTLPPRHNDFILDPGQWRCGQPCTGWFFYGSGRMPLNVAKLVATAPSGRTVDIAVRDGWFAAAFAHRDPSEHNTFPKGKLTAYDAAGKSVGSVEYSPVTR